MAAFKGYAVKYHRYNHLDGTSFVGPERIMHNYDFTDAELNDCDMSGVIFEECTFTGASLKRTKLTGTSFYYCTLSGVDFSFADLSYTSFIVSNLANTNFTSAILQSTMLGVLPPENVEGLYYFSPAKGQHIYAVNRPGVVMFSHGNLYGDYAYMSEKEPHYSECMLALDNLVRGKEIGNE